jgi:hypothetical protein
MHGLVFGERLRDGGEGKSARADSLCCRVIAIT